MQKLNFQQMLIILAILIGGTFAILNPDMYSKAMDHTILSVILIAVFFQTNK
jgi:Na+-transporting NADH:ubiquinone oxidoreductase subunit NqrB